ncbi:Actin-binding FH2 [Penicillium lagena]|uniref:Actin-binding FH2 n=1 Tax=Penicillium lagena TaxID=94218 RepID=UPI0025403C72|nr:Actin-binding FH2 [Penicillium lagena]KAJ5612177.1 Actin-binding FH2 [Penicillium lagena]
MPSILTEADKETVKRNVPKPANKILAVAVARLYVAYPDNQRWTYTGIQGAAVLCNDLVGRTFWLKVVDISPAARGVIWDQEIFDNFSYNQDRTFFHTFELEQCPAGLSFADEKEAKTFIKKVHDREDKASKETKHTPFASSRGQGPAPVTNGKASRSLFGSLLHRGHSNASAAPPAPAAPAPSIQVAPPPPALPPTAPAAIPAATPAAKGDLPFDTSDPEWAGLLGELKQMGITEDQIADNSDFIKAWIDQKQSAAAEPSATGRAPPPPPPAAPKTNAISPQPTGASASRGRGPPPPPPSRKARPEAPEEPASPPPPPREPSPPVRRFNAPPPFADAGKFVEAPGPALPKRLRANSGANGPPPPPRPPKTPADDSAPRFGVPPPFSGDRKVSAPPAPPSRSPAPPGPPLHHRELQLRLRHHTHPNCRPRFPQALHLDLRPLHLLEALLRRLYHLRRTKHRLRDLSLLRPPSRQHLLHLRQPLLLLQHHPLHPEDLSHLHRHHLQRLQLPRAALLHRHPKGALLFLLRRRLLDAAGLQHRLPLPLPRQALGLCLHLLHRLVQVVLLRHHPRLVEQLRLYLKLVVDGTICWPLSEHLEAQAVVKASEKKDRSAAMVPGGAAESSAAASSTPSGPQGGLAGALQDALKQRKQRVSGSDDEKDDDDDW